MMIQNTSFAKLDILKSLQFSIFFKLLTLEKRTVYKKLCDTTYMYIYIAHTNTLKNYVPLFRGFKMFIYDENSNFNIWMGEHQFLIPIFYTEARESKIHIFLIMKNPINYRHITE